MTYARSGQFVQMQLIPMQLPKGVVNGIGSETSISLVGDSFGGDVGGAGLRLVIYPGEPSEMLVRLENISNRLVQLRLEIEGSFPQEWCRIAGEGQDIAPHREMEVLLYFLIPTTFFEDAEILHPGQTLILDYRCRLFVYCTEVETGRQQIEQAVFNIYIRPRSLYQKFLPAIYSQGDFIGRFLKIFEETFEPTVQAMDVLWAYLDPLTAPESLLPFLAYWVAWPMDRRWNVNQQRLLIRQALELYRWRGTKRGLRLYLHLYTDLPLDDDIPEESNKHICIQEVSSKGFVLSQTRLGQESIIGGGRVFHFVVTLRSSPGCFIDEELVRNIIEREKPAFCTYQLYIQK